MIELPDEAAGDEVVVERPLLSRDGAAESVLVLVDVVLLLFDEVHQYFEELP